MPSSFRPPRMSRRVPVLPHHGHQPGGFKKTSEQGPWAGGQVGMQGQVGALQGSEVEPASQDQDPQFLDLRNGHADRLAFPSLDALNSSLVPWA